jgi:hypothetical protein
MASWQDNLHEITATTISSVMLNFAVLQLLLMGRQSFHFKYQFIYDALCRKSPLRNCFAIFFNPGLSYTCKQFILQSRGYEADSPEACNLHAKGVKEL